MQITTCETDHSAKALHAAPNSCVMHVLRNYTRPAPTLILRRAEEAIAEADPLVVDILISLARGASSTYLLLVLR